MVGNKSQRLSQIMILSIVLMVSLLGNHSATVKASTVQDPPVRDWVSFDDSSRQSSPSLGLINQESDTLTVQVNVPGVFISNNKTGSGEFTVLEADDLFHSTVPGAPDLPVLRKIIEVPINAEVTISVLSSNSRVISMPELGYGNPILPRQPDNAKSVAEPEFVPPDEAAYASTEFISTDIITIINDFIMRNERFIIVEIQPIQYNPSLHTLKAFSEITFQVSFCDSGITMSTNDQMRLASPAFDLVMDDIAINPNGSLMRTSPPNLGYLIITPDSFEAALAPLVALKQNQGFDVVLAKLDAIGTTPQAIKAYIQNAYDSWEVPPTYVLLVGDTNNGSLSMPAWQGSVISSVTDLYYATTAGDDWVPDILLGRLPARNTDQLNNMIDKLISYDAMLGSEAWIKKVALLATDDANNYWIPEGTHNYLVDTYTQINNYGGIFPINPQAGGDKLYAYTHTANSTSVINALNDARSIVLFSGHGNSSGWGSPGLTQTHIRNLTSTNAFSFVGSFACNTGDFNVSESLGETWMIQENKGAIAFIGSSYSSYWGQDDILERKMFDLFYEQEAGKPSVAEMFYAGLLAVGTVYPGSYVGSGHYYAEVYNLLGDPSLKIIVESRADHYIYLPFIVN